MLDKPLADDPCRLAKSTFLIIYLKDGKPASVPYLLRIIFSENFITKQHARGANQDRF